MFILLILKKPIVTTEPSYFLYKVNDKADNLIKFKKYTLYSKSFVSTSFVKMLTFPL